MTTERSRAETYQRYSAYLYERFFTHDMLSELQDLPQWGVWKAQLIDDKRKKVPYNPNHRNVRASVKIPSSWGTLESALTALASGEYSGLGFLIIPPLAMMDIDEGFNRKTNTVTSELAKELMQDIPTYYEASPYKGVHGLVFVEKPIRNIHTAALEIYGHDRFTTITTDHIEGTPVTIAYQTEAIEALIDRFSLLTAPKPEKNTLEHRGGVGLVRLDLLPPEAANHERLIALLNGDLSSVGGDHSRADWNALLMLLHWTGDDVARAKEIFLASTLGQRDKAQDESGKGRRGTTSYVDRTIERIIERRHNPPMKR